MKSTILLFDIESMLRKHMWDAGWSDKLLPIVDQLCQANASEGGRPIVVLAEKDKEEMEEDLAKHGIKEYGSRIIFRCDARRLSTPFFVTVLCCHLHPILWHLHMVRTQYV